MRTAQNDSPCAKRGALEHFDPEPVTVPSCLALLFQLLNEPGSPSGQFAAHARWAGSDLQQPGLKRPKGRRREGKEERKRTARKERATMLPRRALLAGAAASFTQPQWIQVRNMATLKDITRRLKSIKNIQKITKSMKMVSAAKYARAERELKPARIYGLGALALYEKAEIKAPEDKKKYLIIGVSSDRGLCGAIHSSIAKNIKGQIANLTGAGKEVKVVGVGDKLRTLLHRTHGNHFLFNFKEVGRKPPTFGDASVIALELLNSGYEFDEGSVIFNRFRSVISYKTDEKPVYSLETVSGAESMSIYDDIDADVLRNYQEFTLANIIFYSLKESTTSEQSARMTAMDNASKNAAEMIDKLTLTFNRTRQAVITKELIEIISGAAALN